MIHLKQLPPPPLPHLIRTRCTAALRQAGFTIIELILVIGVMSLVLGLVSYRVGALDFWKEENAIRQLSETLVFLHNQAVMDQAFYRLEFDVEKNAYRVGVMRAENNVQANSTGVNLSYLTLELAALLSPGLDEEATMIPPPSFPSLAEPRVLPGKLTFTDIVTPRGKIVRDDRSEEKPFLIFSPRGFSEFGVIHMTVGSGKPVTILVNPWTGLAEVYREYKEFQWTLGKSKNK